MLLQAFAHLSYKATLRCCQCDTALDIPCDIWLQRIQRQELPLLQAAPEKSELHDRRIVGRCDGGRVKKHCRHCMQLAAATYVSPQLHARTLGHCAAMLRDVLSQVSRQQGKQLARKAG